MIGDRKKKRGERAMQSRVVQDWKCRNEDLLEAMDEKGRVRKWCLFGKIMSAY